MSNLLIQEENLITRMKNSQISQMNSGNNNDDDYESNYADDLAKNSGRISGGSRESAFSSSGSDGEETTSSRGSSTHLDSSISDSNSTSGRSSSNRDSSQADDENESLDDSGAIDSTLIHGNLIPERADIIDLIDEIRTRILDELSEDICHEIDLVEMQKSKPQLGKQDQSAAFRWISRFINFKQLNGDSKLEPKEVSEICHKVIEFLKFRCDNELPTARYDQFGRDFYILNGIFSFGIDKQGLPVLYLRARVHRKWSQRLDDSFRRYVAWQVDRITKSYVGAKVAKTIGVNKMEKDGSFAICFDCLNVSYSCMDMEFLRYLVRLLVQHYPTYCRYALCVDLPWLFRSVWKLVQTWLPEEARNTVHLITCKQLVDYIDENQIPNSMKINNLKASEKPIQCKHRLPDDWSSLPNIDDMAKDLEISTNEIKQFKAHVEKVRKEYEQMGAL